MTLFNSKDCNTPGFPVHHQLPELTQTHVHRVGNAIQPSHPLSSPSPPAFNLSQHQGFSNESVLWIRWPKYWSFSFSISPSNEYSGLISFRWTGWISLQSKELSRVFSNTTGDYRIYKINTVPFFMMLRKHLFVVKKCCTWLWLVLALVPGSTSH